ncbi:thioredoxin family protein [Flavobacterium buctense]|uniref:Thioredoxin family protein n=1 Tax=Flavobacterium buctense TaxID=1648146 RepID=A0ABU9E1M7_9FLAO|nr:thioredoxin family protein [Flavobacterium buctense]
MKKIFLAAFLLISATSLAQNWTTNFEEAKATAEKEGKSILLVFSGSDWCATCIKLDKNVWQSEVFKAYAQDKLVLLRADFPKKKNNALPDELRTSNLALAEKYNKEGFFPLVVVLDKKGKVIAKKGYENQSADKFVAELQALIP